MQIKINNVDKDFIEETNHSIEILIIIQLENVARDKDQAKQCRKQFDEHWKIT